MRLITYQQDGRQKIGGWIENDAYVVDLSKAAELQHQPIAQFANMQKLIESGEEAWHRAQLLIDAHPDGSIIPTANIKLLAPLPRPVQLRDCMCFPEHLINCTTSYAEEQIKQSKNPEETKKSFQDQGYFELDPKFYDFPVYYITNRMTVHGTDTDVTWPACSQYIDYELSWAAVIGKRANAVSATKAQQHIFGYTVFNDWSARDEQFRAMGAPVNVGPGPGKDFANGLGPCIVTKDELENPYDLNMKARINGVEKSSGNSSGMYFKFEDLIEYLSRTHSLEPGEIIGSGTVGTGCALERGERLSHNDMVELEMEGIGILRNRVLAPHMA